ncbi:hypothetical protein M917_1444 [Psychrobacter aquaticus CMS 56]|uniref:Uncharacterized protein n=1 Tax=Psychrobacter aquaticus CMS 56 TaxID=1354303 RepID=U4T3D4_9GAMM|nr:hypothetical protein M917_1444 [Psychrobacter aquaticus CMS 56]
MMFVNGDEPLIGIKIQKPKPLRHKLYISLTFINADLR